jgi:UDP-glucose 4-epimerase
VRIAITGGAGFIGHHLVWFLVREGHEVVVLDNLRRSTFERPQLRGSRCIDGDIRDPTACLEAFDGADTIIHLAAQSNVMGSESDSDYTFGTNVVGTWEVAQAARRAGVNHLVFASSREVYGDQAQLPVSESAALNPRNTYGASKVAGEAILSVLGSSWPAVSIVRLSNVIGPGDSGRVIPLWLRNARAGCPLKVFGGGQVLDLVPVAFVCSALARIVTGNPLEAPLNIASGTQTPMLRLARRIIELTDSASAVEVVPARGPEVTRFCADVTNLRAVLQMEPPSDPLGCIEASW